MSLHFPWTCVRDPLLPSVWWSVTGAMSSQPGESLHGSQHKSPECSKLRVFATFPPLPHVSKQLSTLCPPCLHDFSVSLCDIRDSECGIGHVYKHGEQLLLGKDSPLAWSLGHCISNSSDSVISVLIWNTVCFLPLRMDKRVMSVQGAALCL